MSDIVLQFQRSPSALAYMAGAFVPKGRQRSLTAPHVDAVWRSAALGRLLPAGAGAVDEKQVHPVYLHAASMRLMMAVLTHRSFPVPIWNILQIRNRITQHHAVVTNSPVQLAARIADLRVLPQGAEFDLATTVTSKENCVLEATSTFFVRGRFGAASSRILPQAPTGPGTAIAAWSVTRRGAAAFGRLTGDYNGVHFWGRYARAFGFRGAFAHPHRVLAQIIDRVPGVDLGRALQVEVWFKGPVYYGRPLELFAGADERGSVFALHVDGDERPAILGRISAPPSPVAPDPPADYVKDLR